MAMVCLSLAWLGLNWLELDWLELLIANKEQIKLVRMVSWWVVMKVK